MTLRLATCEMKWVLDVVTKSHVNGETKSYTLFDPLVKKLASFSTDQDVQTLTEQKPYQRNLRDRTSKATFRSIPQETQ